MRLQTLLVGLLAAALLIHVMGHDAHGAEAVEAWHPQSTHEHGSLGQARPYGMVAHSAGISENHEGFKQFEFMVRGDMWFLTVH